MYLKEYQDQYYKLGIQFEEEHWYKIYSKKEPKVELRKLYETSWIDYKKQLKEGLIISSVDIKKRVLYILVDRPFYKVVLFRM